jgi:hypothetical protein
MIYRYISILSIIFLSSCAMTGIFSDSGRGGIITNVTEPVTATSSSKVRKSGKSCTRNILGIASFGDASVHAAKRNGNVAKVASVDKDIFNVLGIYGSVCTIVRGI